MTSQQPPEGLSAEVQQCAHTRHLTPAQAWKGRPSRCSRAAVEGPYCRQHAKMMAPTPAPDPKAGEREQVAEAVERLRADAYSTSQLGRCVVTGRADLKAVLSALAEARSEVEKERECSGFAWDAMTSAQADMRAERARAEAAEAERDTLAAQLVGAREALEPFARIGDSYVEGDYSFRIESTRSTPYSFGRLDVERARQALSMSILRGDKGCFGAEEAPSGGSPADSQTSGGAE